MKQQKNLAPIITKLLCCFLVAGALLRVQAQGYVPKRGFVPDRSTALAIAEAVLLPMLTKPVIDRARPFTAQLSGNVWIVRSKHIPSDWTGMRIYLRISRKTGAILYAEALW